MAQHKQHQLRQSHPTYLFFRSILCSTPFLTNCCLLPQKFSFLARLQSSMIKRLVIPMIQVPMSLLPTSTMTSSIPWTKFSTATRSFSNIFSRLISLLIRLPSALAILFRWAPVLKLSRNFSIQFNPFIPYLVIPLTWTVFGFRFLGRPSPSTPGGSLFRAISTLTKFSLCWDFSFIEPPNPKDAKRNLVSASIAPQDVDTYIQTELAHGALLGPFNPIPGACGGKLPQKSH